MNTGSNEIAHYGEVVPPAVAAQPPVNTALSQLALHAQAIGDAMKLATTICASKLVPEMYQGKPENGAAAILYGAELGLTPIQSLQQIFVVRGTPAIYSRTMVALLKSKGHRIWAADSNNTSVTVCGQLKGDDHVEESTWTIDRAKQAGYTTNAKYQSDPQAMLYAKAAAEVCRKIAPDALLGIAYSREELEMEQQPIKAKAERISGGLSGLRGKLGMPVHNSGGPDEQAGNIPENIPPTEPTTAQLQKLAILLDQAGLQDRDTKLGFLAQTFGREFGSSKELTRGEASSLINDLEVTSTPETPAEEGSQ